MCYFVWMFYNSSTVVAVPPSSAILIFIVYNKMFVFVSFDSKFNLSNNRKRVVIRNLVKV